MDLKSSDVWDVLEASGVTHLHHANSVLTSCQFLRKKALLSRGTVEDAGLRQTSQYSDGTDRRYSVWYDVFADGVDIHKRASQVNKYGPVLFVLSLEKLRAVRTGRVWVTKLNPVNWTNTTRSERWFQSKQDLEENYQYGTFNQMIVFRHCGGVLPIENCLEKIVLDEPNKNVEGFDLSSTAYGALTLAMCDSGLDVPIKIRKCADSCRCAAHYRSTQNHDHTVEMFYPYG